MEKKLFLIDGHSLIFRMYYAFLRHPMINSKGVDVSILFGFTRYLLELVEKEKPTHIAVCFDPPGKTFRHEMFPQYKGTRQATPELVIEALEPLIDICKSLGMPVLMIPGFEGDDVLGSLAVQSAAKGFKVYMVTPDKDFGQLVSENIKQFKPGKSGADNEILGPAELCANLGLDSPSQVIDMLTICGDTADNVPGVNGVGDKGASKLLKEFGSVDGIYANLDKLTPRQAELFRAAEPHIDLSRRLVTIKIDIELDVTEQQLALKSEHQARIAELFDRYEFFSLKKYIHLASGECPVAQSNTKTLKTVLVSPEDICRSAKQNGNCAVVVEAASEGLFSKVRNITIAVGEVDGSVKVCDGKPALFRDILQNESISKCGYSLKQGIHLLQNEGISLEGDLNDLELMHYLVNPEKSHKVEILARTYLEVNLEDEDEAPSEPEPSLGLFDAPVEDEKPRQRFREAASCALLQDALFAELDSLGARRLFEQIERPLIRVLARMERCGVKVDLGALSEYALSLSDELVQIEDKVRIQAGEPELNVSSPKQVGQVLFEKLRIDPRMKPKKDAKNSYPTDEETLMNYADENPIIGDILEYRAVKKLLNTYIEPFGGWVAPQDGRIHTSFNQALTATGRLSSSRPNLQNIPIRTERGQQIRKAFVAPSRDCVILSADYSQIELRLMAHMCGDANMTEAFLHGVDVHSVTASRIFGVSFEDVTPQMRRTAKTANFGILYGISAFGLAQRLRIPRVAAKKIIEDYFAGFPTIRQWIDNIKAQAARDGYVETLMGRRRYLPDINSRNATARSLAERNAVNAPVQGTAADIIKLAMIRVDERIAAEGLRSRMVLQIHDELVFESPRSEVEKLSQIVKQEMENVIKLSVPLTVECNYGENWLQAH